MSSTCNKNSPGDYAAEQRALQHQAQYRTATEYGLATPTLYAGKGLLQGRMPNTELAENTNDVESFLFGIGSTNLVKPKEPVKPEQKHHANLSIVDRDVPLIMPRNMRPEPNQRPYPI